MKQKEKRVITPERKKYLMELNAAWHREQKRLCEEQRREAEVLASESEAAQCGEEGKPMTAVEAHMPPPEDEAAWERMMEEEEREYNLWCRHGMNEEDWRDFQTLYYRRQERLWRKFIRHERDTDYDSGCIFIMLKFRIERMIDYWEEFSHLENGDYILSQMRLATRLIEIILGYSHIGYMKDTLPYVNLRNKDRMPQVRFASDSDDTPQGVRFRKAYSLLFKLLEENIMHWWD